METKNDNVRATDRARDVYGFYCTHDCGALGLCRECERALKGTFADAFPAALDFADAVEAALAMRGGSHPADSLVEKATRKALTAFLAALDAAGGE